MTTIVLSGHGLIDEGAAFVAGNPRGNRRVQSGGVGGTGFGLCSCGERSPILESGGQRKKWHREHKAALFDAMRSPGQ